MASPNQVSTKAPVFPADAVRNCLRDELVQAARDEAQRRGTPLVGRPQQIAAMPVELDSLTVVETLCALDDILPFQLDEEVVRAGGYDSIDEGLAHLLRGIEEKWKAHHKGATA